MLLRPPALSGRIVSGPTAQQNLFPKTKWKPRSQSTLDEFDTKMMAVTNRRLFTLSILTACLLPPTLVTGFFGMNTKDMPFQNTEGGTWWAALFALAAGLTCYWALRRLRAF